MEIEEHSLLLIAEDEERAYHLRSLIGSKNNDLSKDFLLSLARDNYDVIRSQAIDYMIDHNSALSEGEISNILEGEVSDLVKAKLMLLAGVACSSSFVEQIRQHVKNDYENVYWHAGYAISTRSISALLDLLKHIFSDDFAISKIALDLAFFVTTEKENALFLSAIDLAADLNPNLAERVAEIRAVIACNSGDTITD